MAEQKKSKKGKIPQHVTRIRQLYGHYVYPRIFMNDTKSYAINLDVRTENENGATTSIEPLGLEERIARVQKRAVLKQQRIKSHNQAAKKNKVLLHDGWWFGDCCETEDGAEMFLALCARFHSFLPPGREYLPFDKFSIVPRAHMPPDGDNFGVIQLSTLLTDADVGKPLLSPGFIEKLSTQDNGGAVLWNKCQDILSLEVKAASSAYDSWVHREASGSGCCGGKKLALELEDFLADGVVGILAEATRSFPEHVVVQFIELGRMQAIMFQVLPKEDSGVSWSGEKPDGLSAKELELASMIPLACKLTGALDEQRLQQQKQEKKKIVTIMNEINMQYQSLRHPKADHWDQVVDKQGVTFFWNKNTKESQIEYPYIYNAEACPHAPERYNRNSSATQITVSEATLPRGATQRWEEHTDYTGHRYYFDRETKLSQWGAPAL
eukprot:m.203442 g.203442  ORF g.203442 m.203442 type:complete len:438 (+) comp15762_c0_seq1:178-1491(+)